MDAVTPPVAPLVDGAWLEERLGHPDLRVFDASFYLPTEPDDARAKFAAGHIPGARFFDLDQVADQETDLPHMVPGAGRFAREMTELGVSNASSVVFYDQKGLFSAARGWWLLRLFGHDQVAVLDGGLPKWVAEGRPTEAGAPLAASPGRFQPDFRARMLRGLGDMRENIASGAELVLDARPAGRFDGSVAEPRPGIAPGHIPGAANLPAGALLNPNQTMKTPDALRALFAQAGVDGSRPVVTSCGTGVTAAILSLGLVVAGFGVGALYDGSWTEWGGRADTPKER